MPDAENGERRRAARGSPTVLAVAGDPGGAAALRPVLQRLLRDGADLRLAAYRQALPMLSAIGPTEALPEILPADDAVFCTSLLDRTRPALLLCATSVNRVDWECRLTEAANALGIATLALLDSWSNLRPRFVLDGRLVAPRRVTALDEICRQGLIDAGLAPASIRITGQPALDALRDRPELGPEARAALRAGLGIGADDRLLLFASQPLAAMRRLPGIADPGYDEAEVLDLLTAALAAIVADSGRRTLLLIRPHPREDAAELAQRVRGGEFAIRVERGGDPHALAQAADLVVGMNSWFLVEASQLGCPVLSVQPGLIGDDPLATNRSGETVGVYRADGIGPALIAMLGRPPVMKDRARSGAVEAVLALIRELTAAGRGGG